jgi:hypothetical protein
MTDEVKPNLKPVVVVNDHLEKAESRPPKDPYGNNSVHPDLTLTKEEIIQILD